MPEQTPQTFATVTESLEKAKSRLAASAASYFKQVAENPAEQSPALRKAFSLLSLIDKITKTQLEQQQLFSQSKPKAQDPQDDIEETQAWVKSLGVWVSRLDERINQMEVQLQTLTQELPSPAEGI